MIFRFFSSGKVDEFAKNLAQDIARRYPAVIANTPEQTVSQKRVVEILEEAFTRAHQFARENQLGIFGRAKLGRAFKWKLRELGYEEKFVEMVTEGIAVHRARERK
jgi:hypothetical protein